MLLWVASLIFYSYVYILCELLRYVVLTYESKHPKLVTQLFLEIIGTIQVCAPMFDVNLVLDNYGLTGVFIEISALELANVYLFRDALAHPCPLFCKSAKKRWKILKYLVLFLAELLGAIFSFFLAKLFWKLGSHSKHLEALDEVTVATGCFIEGFATFVTKAFEYSAGDSEFSDYEGILNSLFAGLITVLGINLTGLYGNPVVASACTFNCEGLSHAGHMLVYWLSPLVGWYLAEFCFHDTRSGNEHKTGEKAQNKTDSSSSSDSDTELIAQDTQIKKQI